MKVLVLLTLILCLATADRKRFSSVSSLIQPQFGKADIQSLRNQKLRNTDSNRNQFGTIHRVQMEESQISARRSIDSIFTRHPSSSELDEIVLSADIFVILKVVQNVASDDSLPCSLQVDYLLQVIGRCRSAIQKKVFARDQLHVIIQGAQAEIKRLQDQIQRLQEQKQSFWLDELRDKLKILVKDLRDCFQQFNAVESQIAPNQAKVVGLQNEIKILQKSSDQQRNRIANDKLRIVEIEAVIRDLEDQLHGAKGRRQSLRHSVATSESVIEHNDKMVEKARILIDELEAQIEAIRDKADTIRRRCTQLEIQVQRLRTDIAVSQTKIQTINQEIDQLTDRINSQKKKLAVDDFKSLEHMIEALIQSLEGIQRQIDRQYYYCYGDGAIQIQQTGSVVVYIVRGQSFAHYLLNVYGQSVAVQTGHDYDFYLVDIFSNSWKNRYGEAFSSASKAGTQIALGGDFSCANKHSVQGSGIITKIHGHNIEVQTLQGIVSLNLGACSRVQSIERLPRVGFSMAFRANPSATEGEYDVYSATCW